jgi:hypothetical protein
MGHVHSGERGRDGARVGLALARAGRLVRQATKRDHGVRDERPVHDAVLRQVGKRARERLPVPVAQRTRVGQHRSRYGSEQSRERAQQGGLAGAVGSDDGRHLGRLRGEIDAAQYRPALQVDAEPVRLDPHGASVPIAKFAKPRRQCPEPTSQS